MNPATGMTNAEAVKSGKSCFFSKPHGLWFEDGALLPPVPEANQPMDSNPPAIPATEPTAVVDKPPAKAKVDPKAAATDKAG